MSSENEAWLAKTLDDVKKARASITVPLCEWSDLQREVESLRSALMDPPADVQEAVIKKLGLVSGEALDSANAQVESLRGERDHCREWYGVRLERLSRLIREEIPEPQKTRYFSIIANGTADVNEPPSYASQLNILKHGLDQARFEVEALRIEHQSSLKAMSDFQDQRNQCQTALQKAKVALELVQNKVLFLEGAKAVDDALAAIEECL